jgi:hypothetical protein
VPARPLVPRPVTVEVRRVHLAVPAQPPVPNPVTVEVRPVRLAPDLVSTDSAMCRPSLRTSRQDKWLVPAWSVIDSRTLWRLQGNENPVTAVPNHYGGAPRGARRCPGQGPGHPRGTPRARECARGRAARPTVEQGAAAVSPDPVVGDVHRVLKPTTSGERAHEIGRLAAELTSLSRFVSSTRDRVEPDRAARGSEGPSSRLPPAQRTYGARRSFAVVRRRWPGEPGSEMYVGCSASTPRAISTARRPRTKSEMPDLRQFSNRP